MSLEEIEQGAVRLPSDEAAAAMRTTIVQTVNDVREAARDAVRRWRDLHGETRYSDAPREVTDAWRRDAESRSRRLLTWLVIDAIAYAIDGPANEQNAMLDRLFPPPTPEATTFKIILAAIRLRDRRLDWWAEGNRVCDDLGDDPLYRTVTRQLAMIEWTDRSGGWVRRTDENQAEGDWSTDATWGDPDAPRTG